MGARGGMQSGLQEECNWRHRRNTVEATGGMH